MVYDIETGRSRGFGFVKFDDPRDAEDAINDADGKVSCHTESHSLLLCLKVFPLNVQKPKNAICHVTGTCGS